MEESILGLCNLEREYTFQHSGYLNLLLAPIYTVLAVTYTSTFVVMLLRLLLWKKEWEFARKFREADRKMIAYMLEVFFNMLHHREGIRNLEIENEIETINLDQTTNKNLEIEKMGVVSIPNAPEPNVIVSHSTVIDTHGILRSKLAMTILSLYVANITSLAIVVFWDVFILKEIHGCSDEFDSFYKNGTFINQYCSCIPTDDRDKALSYDVALEFPTAIAEVAGILFLGFNGFAFLMFLKLLVADGVASLCPRIVIYLLLGAAECLVVSGIIGAFLSRWILLEKEDSTNVIIQHVMISVALIVGVATPWAMFLWASQKVIRKNRVLKSTPKGEAI